MVRQVLEKYFELKEEARIANAPVAALEVESEDEAQ